jgi:hypothetical protein
LQVDWPQARVVENLAHDKRFLLTVNGKSAGLTVLAIAVNTRDVADLVRLTRIVKRITNLIPLVAKTLLHLHEELASVDQLHPALASFFLAIAENPNVGGDSSIVEKLIWQCDDSFLASRSQ